MTTEHIKTDKWIIVYSVMDNEKVILDEVYKVRDKRDINIAKILNAQQKREVMEAIEAERKRDVREEEDLYAEE